jgi:hypothetical protein
VLLDAFRKCFSFIDIGLSFFIFSLIDQAEEFLLGRRVDICEVLRLGLTDSCVFPWFPRNPKPYFYVDQYESSDEIISADVLQKVAIFLD